MWAFVLVMILCVVAIAVLITMQRRNSAEGELLKDSVRPRIAFIVDIRRENRNLHLLYKALFELSTDRVDFVSRLFSRPPPNDLDTGAGADVIFECFDTVSASPTQYETNLAKVRDRLAYLRCLLRRWPRDSLLGFAQCRRRSADLP